MPDQLMLVVEYIKARFAKNEEGQVRSDVIWTIVGVLAIVALIIWILGRS